MVYKDQNVRVMTVKAKFRCNSVIDTRFGHDIVNRQVVLNAVYGTEGENKDYAQATPWGELKIQIDKGTPAYEAFEPGQDYYLTFNKV